LTRIVVSRFIPTTSILGERMNDFEYFDYDGKPCVRFITKGKYHENVIVDARVWDDYVNQYNWTILKNRNGYLTVKTSVNKLSTRLYRMIGEKEFNELDYWGNTFDHINNNPLDNRIKNLQISNSKLNSTNILSKNQQNDMHLIFPQHSRRVTGKVVTSYKVHKNIFDEVVYRNFPTSELAKFYRDNELLPYINKRIEDMKKKTRDIEFERGLRDKLNAGEMDEIIKILKKYDVG
jgi:hypothetical protein